MTERLLLDEMHSPTVARALVELGHDVIAVSADPVLRGMTDPELYAWAGEQERRIVTENVNDFRPLLLGALEHGHVATALLLTSSRTFPRSRQSPGALINALDNWLRTDHADTPETWLHPAESQT
jgi:predicted nuclease of predicted toxin-antitoxin system